MFDSRIFFFFFLLFWYTCLLYMLTISAILNGQCLTDEKRLVVFWCAFRFFTIKKMDQRNCIKFCVKNVIKCVRTFEMLIVAFGESTMRRTQVQLCNNVDVHDENIENDFE